MKMSLHLIISSLILIVDFDRQNHQSLKRYTQCNHQVANGNVLIFQLFLMRKCNVLEVVIRMRDRLTSVIRCCSQNHCSSLDRALE